MNEQNLNQPDDAQSSQRPPLIGIIAAFAVVYLVWGSTYLAIRFAVETIPPFLMAGFRFVVAGGIIYMWLCFRGEAKVTLRQIMACAASGLLMLVGGNGLVCWAEQFVPSGITALILGTTPLWIVIVGWVGFGDRAPGVKVWIGLLLGIVGVFLLLQPESLPMDTLEASVGQAVSSSSASTAIDSGSNFFGIPIKGLGVVVILCVCFFWSLGSFLSKSPAMPKSTLLSVSMQMLIAGTVMLLFSFAIGEPMRMDWSAISARSLWALAYLIVFGAIIAYSCYGWLFRNVSSAAVSTYAYVNPVVAVILGFWLAGEKFTQMTIVGAGLILLGVLLVSGRKKI